MNTETDKRIARLEQLILDLQKRLQWQTETADMRKIYLDKMTAECHRLEQVIADLTEKVAHND
jgi:hypothetical protein